MLYYKKTDYIPTIEFKALMRKHLSLYVDYFNFKKDIIRDESIVDNLIQQIKRYIAFYSDNWIEKMTAKEICPFLVDYENVPEKLLLKKSVNGMYNFSLNEEVRNSLNNYNYAPEFMDLINAWAEMKTSMENGRSLLNAFTPTGILTNENRPIYEAPFSYKESDTFRIYTSDISAVTIPTKYVYNIVAPKDYYLIWSDFAQIDLRCAWNMILRYNNKSINQNDTTDRIDFYKMVAQDVALTNNIPFNEEQFKLDRSKYKVGILSTINGASHTSLIRDIGDEKFANNLHKYINEQNLAYVNYKENIRKNISTGVYFYMQTYFGTRMPIPTDGLDKDICTASLNRPFQGTSADIQKLVTVDIYNRMQSLINDPDKFYPILNRHDETLWYIHKDCLKYLNEFNNCCKIKIDDWDLVELEWDIGFNYKKPLQEIKDKYLITSSEECKFNRAEIKSDIPLLQPKPIYLFFSQEKIENQHFFAVSYINELYIMDSYNCDIKEATDKFLTNLLNILKDKDFTRLILMGNREGYLINSNKEIIFSNRDINLQFNNTCRKLFNRFAKNVLNISKELEFNNEYIVNFGHNKKLYYLEGKEWIPKN